MVRKISFLLLSLLACLFFGYLYYAQYFKWRDCFNEEGRCFDAASGVVYHAQSGMVWLPLALLAFAAFAFQVWRLAKRRG